MHRGVALVISFVFALVLSPMLAMGAARAQDPNEPPPPVAAPRVSVMAEELPRAGAIVVFGADMPLGFEIAKALAAANKQVTAVVAEGADHAALDALKVDVLSTDALNLDRLKTTFAAAPMRAVIVPYDIAGERPMLGRDGIRNIIDVTKTTGVPRLLLVSPTGAGDSAGVVPWYVRWLRKDAFAEASEAEAHLKAAGLDYTILRAGWILDEPAGETARLEEGAPVFSWIANLDLARIAAGAIDASPLRGKTATVVDPTRVSLFSALF